MSCYGDIPPKPIDYQLFEPMTAWRLATAQQKKLGLSHAPLMPDCHVAGRSLWRGFAALLALDESGADWRPGVVRWVDHVNEKWREELARPLPALSVCAQGITYDSHKSVIEESIADSFDVAVSLCNPKLGVVDEVKRVIAQAEDCVRALVSFVGTVDAIAGNCHGKSGSDSVREQAYVELDELFRWRIAHMPQEDVSRYVDEWRVQAHITLLELGRRYLNDSAVAQFVPRMVQGRLRSASEAMRNYQWELDRALGKLSGKNVVADVGETEQAREGD